MEAFYKDNHNTIYCLDFRKNDLPSESVQMVCTSPPYWGLRKYSGEQELIWGGDKDCEHQWGSLIPHPMHKSGGHTYLSDISKGTQATQDEVRHKGNLGCWCQLCGAWRGAYGLEPMPEMYIEHTIEILREIRRVLRKDGVVFWNIGDSYAGSGGDHKEWHKNDAGFQGRSFHGVMAKPVNRKPQSAIMGMEPVTWTENGKPKKKGMTRVGAVKGLKPKDLCLIPFRVAIAAQEDGWWVRSVIIWSKPNPMPESVTDRPTESHEYILMLTKSAKYYWDLEAVREPLAEGSWDRAQRSELDAHSVSRIRNKGTGKHGRAKLEGRNIRSVWEFPTQPYPEAHFAVFPEKLPELCIKAATPEVGCCSECGSPWTRVLEKGSADHGAETESAYGTGTSANRLAKLRQSARAKGGEYVNETKTLGWQPTCKCNADKVPSLVLDPFMGAGTTLWVAKKLNRNAVGYEISEEYCQLAVDRCRQQVLI